MRTVNGCSERSAPTESIARSIACRVISSCALAVNASASASNVLDSAFASNARTRLRIGSFVLVVRSMNGCAVAGAPGGGMSTGNGPSTASAATNRSAAPTSSVHSTCSRSAHEASQPFGSSTAGRSRRSRSVVQRGSSVVGLRTEWSAAIRDERQPPGERVPGARGLMYDLARLPAQLPVGADRSQRVALGLGADSRRVERAEPRDDSRQELGIVVSLNPELDQPDDHFLRREAGFVLGGASGSVPFSHRSKVAKGCATPRLRTLCSTA